MEYWVIAAVALVLSALVAFIVGEVGRKSTRKTPHAPLRAAGREPCPLCGATLLAGERLKSELFPGENERLTHIHGCPHCFPPNDRFPRFCPVCRARIDPDGFVVGRMWERPPRDGSSRPRSHLHILGCAACRGSRRGRAG